MRKQKAVLVILFLVIMVGAVNALNIAYQEHLTPTYLDANAIFPTRSHSLGNGGAWLDFGTGGTYDNLMELSLLDAGILPTDHSVQISFTISATALNADNDLALLISDGTSAVGFLRADNSGGEGYVASSAYGSTKINYSLTSVFSNAGFPTEFSGDIVLDNSTTVTGYMGSKSASMVTAQTLDRSADLSLVLAANDPSELYRINWIDITISTEGSLNIPEPATWCLFLVLGITLLARKRK